MGIRENFVCDVFPPKTDIRDLDNARWMIWTQSKGISKLQPTIGALIQWLKRAWYGAKVLSRGRVLVQDHIHVWLGEELKMKMSNHPKILSLLNQ